MIPSVKAPEIDSLIKNVFGADRTKSIKEDVCAWCKNPANSFRDETSKNEYRISGLCQKCQDEIWGK